MYLQTDTSVFLRETNTSTIFTLNSLNLFPFNNSIDFFVLEGSRHFVQVFSFSILRPHLCPAPALSIPQFSGAGGRRSVAEAPFSPSSLGLRKVTPFYSNN